MTHTGSRSLHSKLSIWQYGLLRTVLQPDGAQVSSNQEDRGMRASISTYLKRVLMGIIACGLMLAAVYGYERTPPNTFSPFCTHTFAYRLNVTIETGGRQYSSTVVRQKLK